jgi:predicted nucleic acid-binding protein
MPYLGQLATCSTVLLELGWSATSRQHYERMMDDLGWYQSLDINQEVLALALGLQRDLVARGHHRGPGVADLVLAATAIRHSATVLHYDHDFDLIAKVAPQFAHRWIVPRGTTD